MTDESEFIAPLIQPAGDARSIGSTERRVTPREPICCGAILEIGGRRMAVNILDLSEGGVGVEAPVDIAGPGDAGYLVLDVAVVPLRVVAAQGGRLGLAFTAMSDVAAESVLRVLAEMHRRQKA